MASVVLSASLLALAMVQGAAGAGFEVVAHPDVAVDAVTRGELSKIFLKRLRAWADGTPARPVDQEPASCVRRHFSQRVHERSVVNVEVYWKRMIFSGRAVPPPELAGDAEVLDFVRRTPGAVGYVAAGGSHAGVKKLAVDP